MPSVVSSESDLPHAEYAEADHDLQLMQAIAQGDEQALAELLAQHQEAVRRFVGRLSAWNGNVEDIVQEVFIRAWKKAAQFRVAGSVRSWLYQIAVQRCRHHHRTDVRLLKRLIHLFQYKPSVAKSDTLADDRRWQAIQDAMTELNYSDRELLVLVYLEQESLQAIAARDGIKEATLHVRLHRARQRLADQIERNKVKA